MLMIYYQAAYWKQFNHGEMTVIEAVTMLDCLVDESDPDVSAYYQ